MAQRPDRRSVEGVVLRTPHAQGQRQRGLAFQRHHGGRKACQYRRRITGATPDIEDEIAALEGADAIDDELEQMKKALGKGSAGKED